jgi:hypothetical protein
LRSSASSSNLTCRRARTLEQLGIPRATFHRWCDRFLTGALVSGAATQYGAWVPFLILLVLAVHGGAGDKLARH